MEAVKVKICGLTTKEDIELVNREKPDYIGMVLYFPKSKRNLQISEAGRLLKTLDPEIKAVAVTVSPDIGQVKAIEAAGFGILQVHGELKEEVLEETELPVWRAYNIGKEGHPKLLHHKKIAGYVLDGALPGNGETFDWKRAEEWELDGKTFILAGGLHAGNVAQAAGLLHPEVIDVSSSVEKDASGRGKDPVKVRALIRAVRAL